MEDVESFVESKAALGATTTSVAHANLRYDEFVSRAYRYGLHPVHGHAVYVQQYSNVEAGSDILTYLWTTERDGRRCYVGSIVDPC